MRTLIALLLTFFISACTSQLQKGFEAYNNGNYDTAAAYWNQPAKDGDKYAQHNLGILWANGLGSTKQNNQQAAQWFLLSAKQGYVPAMVNLGITQKNLGYNEAALSWLTLAARWGNKNAIENISSWGKTIPEPDLLIAKQRNDLVYQQMAAQSLSNASYSIGCALGGGCLSVSPPIPRSAYTNNKASYNNKQKTTSTYSSNSCTSDYGCGIGYKCIKPPLKSKGTCMKSVDEHGIRQFNSPSGDSIGPNTNLLEQCMTDVDCPVGFGCDKIYKSCIKR